jgi:hypothetical protein
MKRSTIRLALATIAVGVGTLASCGESNITGPSRLDTNVSSDSAAALLGLFGPRPVFCPTNQTQSTTQVVDALGGLLSIAGTSIQIPAGALLGPATVTLTVPASNYMEIDVDVQGSEHFIFELPAIVSLNYSRCNNLLVRLLPVQAWYWNPETRALLEFMPGVDNKLTRTITFPTIHLSGFIIAN